MRSLPLAALGLLALPGQQPTLNERLFGAAAAGQVEAVRELLAKGANPNARIANGWPVLTMVEGTPAQMLTITKLLVAKGAKVNARQAGQGHTALTHALNRAEVSPALVGYLLYKGADPRIPMNDGLSALHMAVGSGSAACVRLLLARNAPVNPRTRAASDPSPGAHDLRRVELNDHLYEPGFRDSGLTPYAMLGVSSYSGQDRAWNGLVADLLVKAGADPRTRDDNGWTALHHAVHAGRLPAVQALLARGADPNAASKGGFTPLHVAMRGLTSWGLGDSVRLLLAKGADRTARNKAGQTPLELLHADAQWRLVTLAENPSSAMPAGYRKEYLKAVDAVAKLLDPDAAPFRAVFPPVGPGGQRYAPLDIAGRVVDRVVKREGDKAVLTLTFRTSPEPAAVLRITDLMLHSHEPITPLPVVVSLAPGRAAVVRVEFPTEAAEGGAVGLAYEFKTKDGGGSGEQSEAPPPEAGVLTQTQRGRWTVTFLNPVEGRTILVVIDSVRVGGRLVPSFAGRELRVEANGPVAVPGLDIPQAKAGKSVPWRIAYRSRLLPNKRWRAGSTGGP